MSISSSLNAGVMGLSVNGTRLEGAGVTPTIEQLFDIRYAGGKDPQIERALEELSKDQKAGERSDISAP